MHGTAHEINLLSGILNRKASQSDADTQRNNPGWNYNAGNIARRKYDRGDVTLRASGIYVPRGVICAGEIGEKINIQHETGLLNMYRLNVKIPYWKICILIISESSKGSALYVNKVLNGCFSLQKLKLNNEYILHAIYNWDIWSFIHFYYSYFWTTIRNCQFYE